MIESRSCGELAINARREVVFPSNFCSPTVNRNGDAAAQELSGSPAIKNDGSTNMGRIKPLISPD